MTKICAHCGRPFEHRFRKVRYCEATDCRRERQRDTQRRSRLAHPEKNEAAQRRSNVARRMRRHADPAYAATVRARQLARYHRQREAGVSVHKVAPPEVFEELLARQDGVCAICRQPETAKDPSGRTKRLAVDHDRETGAVRGLLCGRCNTALGLLRHDPERAAAAVDYLVKNGLRLVG